jgi:hypothetical protein
LLAEDQDLMLSLSILRAIEINDQMELEAAFQYHPTLINTTFEVLLFHDM